MAKMHHYFHPHLLLLARTWPTLTYVLVSSRPTGRSPEGAPSPSARKQAYHERLVRHGQPPSIQHGRAPTHEDRNAQVLARTPAHGGKPRHCCRPGWHRRKRKCDLIFPRLILLCSFHCIMAEFWSLQYCLSPSSVFVLDRLPTCFCFCLLFRTGFLLVPMYKGCSAFSLSFGSWHCIDANLSPISQFRR